MTNNTTEPSKFKSYFINPDTNIIRTGWRVLISILLLAGLTMGFAMGLREILGGLPKTSNWQYVVRVVPATVAVFLAIKYLDKEKFSSLGLKLNKAALLDCLSGIAIGGVIMAFMFFALLGIGAIEFNGFVWWSDSEQATATLTTAGLGVAVIVFLQFVAVSWSEELLFRGYLMQTMMRGMGLKWGVIISSVLFGFAHAGNPDATMVTNIFIILIALQIVYAYLKTGSLWLPLGLHLGWNFFQASVFGFASSGQASPALISQTAVGPTWISGGPFGAEASYLIIPVTFASLWLIHWSTKKIHGTSDNLMDFNYGDTAKSPSSAPANYTVSN